MKILVGNWKMNGSLAANQAWLHDIKAKYPTPRADTMLAVCVPYPYLAQCQAALQGSAVAWGAQNVSAEAQGAFTGEVSAAMLADFGCRFVIVGHSERRTLMGETDALVAKKLQAALTAGLQPIVCVGETLAEREAEQVQQVVGRQLAALVAHLSITPFIDGKIIVAYEPLWAIGTGKTASPEQAEAVHDFIHRQLLQHGQVSTPILYGGSMNAQNARALLAMPNIHGGLIGGASLQVDSFLAIAHA